MKYQANTGSSSFEIEIVSRDDGQLLVRVGEDEQLLRVDAQSAATFTLSRDQTHFDAHVVRHGAAGERVYLDNQCFDVELLDERQLRSRHATQSGGEPGHQTIVSPMPGKIVNLLKKLGERVTAGEGVIVVEAMKMENELKAAVDGIVVELSVQAGDTVDGGATLLHIAPAETDA